MRKALQVITALLMISLLVGCKGSSPKASSLTTYGETVSGGKEMQGVDITKIETSESDGRQRVSVSFDSGGKPTDSIPAYSLRALEAPYRLVLEVKAESISALKDAEWNLVGDIAGLFALRMDEKTARVYIQLNAADNYTVEENGNQLIIWLEQAQPSNDTKYYAYADLYEEYQYGAMPPGMSELTPTLCANINQIILISHPYDDSKQAQAYADKLQEILDAELPGKAAYVTELQDGKRPETSGEMLSKEAAELNVISRDGKKQKLPVVMSSARFLSAAADGSKLFVEEAPSAEGTQTAEQLAILSPEQHKQRLTTLADIFSIESAAYAPDGRAICFIEGVGDGASLYHYNLDTEKLTNLSEEGLGNVTRFVYATDSTIYALADQIMQVSINGESFSYSTLIEEPMGGGTIGYSDGRVFYADGMLTGEGYIYEVKDGALEQFVEGTRFTISPDGTYMAAILDTLKDDGSVGVTLNIVDMKTEQSTLVPDVNELFDFDWDLDSEEFFYCVPSGSDEFPSRLMAVNAKDGSTRHVLDMVSGEMLPAGNDEMYVVIGMNKGQSSVTFSMNVGK